MLSGMNARLTGMLLIMAIAAAACAPKPIFKDDHSDMQVANQTQDSNSALLGDGLESQNVLVEDVTYHGNTKGFLAKPKEAGKYPGIVMIHEWWGLNENIKNMAKQLAAQGYVVLAVDLYDGQFTNDPSKARELVTKVRENSGPALENLKAAVSFLQSHKNVVSDKIASLGWCFGGGMSLQLAMTGTPLAATIIYYGSLETSPEKLSAIKQPILGIFGEIDTSIPLATVTEFNQSLGEIGVQRDIYVYTGVGHAFANPSGQNYAPLATRDAWDKTLDFLEKNLKQ